MLWLLLRHLPICSLAGPSKWKEKRGSWAAKNAKNQIVAVISKFPTAHVKDFPNLDISSLKRHCDILAEPLTQRINISMTSGKKYGKKQKSVLFLNLGYLNQASEKIAAMQLMNHLDINNYLSITIWLPAQILCREYELLSVGKNEIIHG